MASEERIPSETIDEWPMILKEYPFVKAGMTPDEYWEERRYYGEHFSEVLAGTYQPLWQQNK